MKQRNLVVRESSEVQNAIPVYDHGKDSEGHEPTVSSLDVTAQPAGSGHKRRHHVGQDKPRSSVPDPQVVIRDSSEHHGPSNDRENVIGEQEVVVDFPLSTEPRLQQTPNHTGKHDRPNNQLPLSCS